ncbi:MAG: hypothetical protein CBC29_05595 [Methylococcaceae bacterium TMED69]|nr:MAG: hypothetical protein CBC29_05595 [Methylococcaceae bacterium TMED69]|tara:strand:+ start:1328 stop:1789 length:462 start_codon:yes stop_codon:yes gene_type:complete
MPKVIVDATKGLYQATSDSNNSALNVNSGLVATPYAFTAPADAAGAIAAASTIPIDQTLILVSDTSDANDRAFLPAPAAVPDGKVYYVVAVEAFELSSDDDGSNATTMNGVAVTDGGGSYAKEIAIAAGTGVVCVKTSATNWAVIGAAAAADA